MKTFKGKAIYNPSGKAGEYSYWACNFYTGCSNGCTYCYLKKGVLAHAMGGDKPTLKKCFKHEKDALDVFEKELKANLPELQKHGLFFSFTTDPMLQKTIHLTVLSISICMDYNVPVKILTKTVEWIDGYRSGNYYVPFPFLIKEEYKAKIAFGFTLTGHDELEPGASTNAERIEAMKRLHEAGFKTFASIEPVIDYESSLRMIKQAQPYCDLFKIGLMSGKKYNERETVRFMLDVISVDDGCKYYFKDSILSAAGFAREHIINNNCVARDYNLFRD